MKNLGLILNAVLLVAVAVLFYLQFSGKSATTPSTNNAAVGSSGIAYVNSDTLIKYYQFVIDRKIVLEAKGKRLEGDLEARYKGLQNDVQAYQRNVNSMTLGQVKATEEDLGRKQQNLQMYEQSLSQEVMKDQAVLTKELYDRITRYLDSYSKKNGIQVVLKYDTSSDVLYIGSALDISKEVVAGLNAEYKDQKSGVKSDTTTTK